ncbi:MAG: bifunctional chorismate mutase/prephenate dehydratase [Anaerostipes sp.]|nr:bifunctional chorismate mutase/prephenate dehydratase [Anaerostipes sp.]MDD4371317.1 bifunctional chorismate mutase/prephenate dehydratase [Anaerostipes sp.]
MRDLSEIRKDIDRIDQSLVRLLGERMNCSSEVAEYKRGTHKPIYDKKREDEKLLTLTADEQNPFMARAIEEVFLQIMSISRRYQYSILSNEDDYIEKHFKEVDELLVTNETRVAYQGVPGAYQEQAMVQFFGEEVQNFHVQTFEDVIKAVDEGKADYGVLPIENSSAGTVSGIYDMLLNSEVCVVGEEIVECNHALVGIPGTQLEKVEKVYSHPQGLMQCNNFLKGWKWEQIDQLNTAVGAKKVATDNDKTKVAISSERAAKLYGLDILRHKINNEGNNCTRFVIMSKEKQYKKDAEKISISFSLPHETGTLYNILAHFMFNDISMCNIESRPLPNRQWEYGFYIDVIGNLNEPSVKNALIGIREEVNDFKILGNF